MREILTKLNKKKLIFSVIMTLIALICVCNYTEEDAVAEGEKESRLVYDVAANKLYTTVGTEEVVYDEDIEYTALGVIPSVSDKVATLVLRGVDYHTTDKIAFEIVNGSEYKVELVVDGPSTFESVATDGDSSSDSYYGIHCDTDLVIRGDSVLNVSCDRIGGTAIHSTSSIDIKGGTLNVVGGSVSIYASEQSAGMDGEVDTENTYGIYANNKINVSGGVINASTSSDSGETGTIATSTSNGSSINISGGSIDVNVKGTTVNTAPRAAGIISYKVNLTGGTIRADIQGKGTRAMMAYSGGITVGDQGNADGKSVNMTVRGDVASSDSNWKYGAIYTEGGDLTVYDGTVDVQVTNSTDESYITGINIGGTFTMNGGTFITSTDTTRNVDGSTVYGQGDGAVVNEFILNAGTIKAYTTANRNDNPSGMHSLGNATIKGGKMESINYCTEIINQNTPPRGFYVNGQLYLISGSLKAQGIGGALHYDRGLNADSLSNTAGGTYVLACSTVYDPQEGDFAVYDSNDPNSLLSYKYLELGRVQDSYIVCDMTTQKLYKSFGEGQMNELTPSNYNIESITENTIIFNGINYDSTLEYGIKIITTSENQAVSDDVGEESSESLDEGNGEAGSDETGAVNIIFNAGSTNNITATKAIEGMVCAIYCDTDVVISGAGSANLSGKNSLGMGYGIYSEGSITIEEGTIVADGAAEGDIGIHATKITMSDGSLEAMGKEKAIEKTTDLSFTPGTGDTGVQITKASTSYDGSTLVNYYDKNEHDSYKYLKTGKVTNYYLYCDGNTLYKVKKGADRVNEKVLVSEVIEGISIKNGTLTLDGFEFETSAEYCLYVDSSITVELKGASKLVSKVYDTGSDYCGICFAGDTTNIGGAGELDISRSNAIPNNYVGMYFKGTNGTADIASGTYRIKADDAHSTAYAIKVDSGVGVTVKTSDLTHKKEMILQGKTNAIEGTISITDSITAGMEYDGSDAAKKRNLDGTERYIQIEDVIISIDIEWGDMSFKTTATWDVEKHDYVDCSWAPATEGSNLIRINNAKSTVSIATTITFTSTITDVVGSFREEIISGEMPTLGRSSSSTVKRTIPKTSIYDAYLELEGTPTGIGNYGKIGAITITVGDSLR